MTNLRISRLYQLIIIFITRTCFGIYTSVSARALTLFGPAVDIIHYPLILNDVFGSVAPLSPEEGRVVW